MRHAEPHRRSPLLDRALHRAQRRNSPHPRRAPPAAARGPVDRRRHRVPLAPARHGLASARARRDRPPRGRARQARRRPDESGIHRLCAHRRPRERAPGPRDRLDRAVGDPQHDERTDAATTADRQGARVLPMGARAIRARRGHRRLVDEPGRGLAVLHARAQHRARRHDGAAARDAVADPGIRPVVDDDPALVRRLRGLPAHLPRDAERARTRRSSCCWTACSRARSSTRSRARRTA